MENPLNKIKTTKTSRNNSKIRIFLLILFLVSVMLNLFALLKFISFSSQENLNADVEISTLEKLSKIILLPEEVPTIAEIQDVEKLKNSNAEFYKNARSGDKLILFSEKAIIFREEESLIINVALVAKQS